MANKITKREMFTMIMAVEGVKANPEMVAFLEHEVELLNKKAGSKKPTKTQKENEAMLPTVIEALASLGKPSTVTEVIATGMLGEISNQKGSALLKKLFESGEVEKSTEKGKTLFFLPSTDEVED